ncbi:MAG: AarF/ABC1/UbiB kinase family protein [Baekduia sp.]
MAQVGRVAGSQGARSLATKAANVARSDEKAAAANAERQLAVAEQLVTLLGTMRGVAMKIGQTLSVADFGLVSDEHREEIQAKLAALQDDAPTAPWKKMKPHIEKSLGDRIDDLFDDFDPEPVAAASIGQVYKATLAGGRPVAVKVQYPGIARAVRSDLKNLRLFAPTVKGLFPGIDLPSIVDEIEERVLEELDYEHEANNQRMMARAYRGHPFIRVPDVHSGLCTDAVLVSDWIDGRPLPTAYEAGQEQRNRVAEILFRFYMGSPYLHRCFSGDPHPGNTLVLDDGTLAFIDFGLMKTLTAESVEDELDGLRAIAEGNADRVVELFRAHGLKLASERISPDEVLEALRYSQGWYILDEDPELTPAKANEIAGRATDPTGPIYRVFKTETLPDQHMVQRRVELLVGTTIGQLRPKGVNFFRIAREWIYGDDPVTELGRAEAAWRGDGQLGSDADRR